MSNDVITQEKIELLLKNAGQVDSQDGGIIDIEHYLTAEEKDVLGEIGNMCMGASVTTMNEMLGRKVMITTPYITMHTPNSLGKEYPVPIVVVEVQYTEGILGNNLLLLKEYDVALITDLLMGGEGNIDPNDIVLDEMQLSAIREVMNQMVGSSATSLATILNRAVNISTPQSRIMLLAHDAISEFMADDVLVKIAFKMNIEDLLESEIMQVWPASFAKKLVGYLLNPDDEADSPPPEKPTEVFIYNKATQTAEYIKNSEYAAHAAAAIQPVPTPSAPPISTPSASMSSPPPAQAKQAKPTFDRGSSNTNQDGISPIRPAGETDAKAVRYPSFDLPAPQKQADVPIENLGMLMDVPMQVTVELGKTRKRIREILDLNTGSIVVLEKIAGGAVDVLVNGMPIARGEVVVIDENYGVRITEINTEKLKENT